MRKLFFLAFLLFFISSFFYEAAALGITPARTTLNFEPSLEKDVAFSVINSEHKDMAVLLMIRGPLNESITLNDAYAEFSSDQDSRSFSYHIRLPERFEKPGTYEGEIVALELPKDFKNKGTFVGATLAVVTQLEVHVPYPGKYVDAEVTVIPGKETQFFIPVINRGELDIGSVRATIDIFSSQGGLRVDSIETDTSALKSLERKELTATWKNATPGTYYAKISVFYDNEVAYLENEFAIGEQKLNLLQVYVKDFHLGEIAKFNAVIENTWSQDVKDAYLDIIAYNARHEIMADIKSQNYKVPALSKIEMVSYWDTVGVHEGTYDGKIILNYGKTTEKPVQITIKQDEITVLGVTGRVITPEKGTFNFQHILVGVVVLLVILNIIWFVLIRKIMRKKDETRQREKGVERAKVK